MAARWLGNRLSDMIVEIRDACYLFLALRHTGTTLWIEADAVGNQLGVSAGTVKKQLDRIKNKHNLNIKVTAASGNSTKFPHLDANNDDAAAAATFPSLGKGKKTEESTKEQGKDDKQVKEQSKGDKNVRKRGASRASEGAETSKVNKKKTKMSSKNISENDLEAAEATRKAAGEKAESFVKVKTEAGENAFVAPSPKTTAYEDFIDSVNDEDGWETDKE